MPNPTPTQSETAKVEPKTQPRRPNEQGSFVVQAHMRIFDPQTKQVYIEGRA